MPRNLDTCISLDKVCITASSLNSIMRKQFHAPHELKKEMHKMAISTIRRMVGAKGEDNPVFIAGHVAEDQIVCDFYQGANFQTQKVCEKVVDIAGKTIIFHATLDVFDYINNLIVEIKSIQTKKVPSLGVKEWMNNVYCAEYDTQAQVQMLCLSEYYKFLFHIWDVKNNQHYTSKPWRKDEDFINKNKKIILDYWNILNHLYHKYLSNDKNVHLEVWAYDEAILEEKRKEFYAGEFDYNIDYALKQKVDDFEDLCIQYKEISELKKQKEKELLSIITPCMQAKGITIAKINNVVVKKTLIKTSINYKEIVVEKKILPTLTEEELKHFSTEAENVYSIRFAKPKKDFFDIENTYLETGIDFGMDV